MWIMLVAALLAYDATPARQDLGARDVGAIADAVLDTILPKDRRLSRMTVAERGIRFDAARTDVSLRRATSSDATPEALGMRRAVGAGDASLLANCDPVGRGPCPNLGDGAYVWMDRVDGDADSGRLRVRVHVVWAEPVPPTRARAGPFLTSFSTVVTLTRTTGGAWRVVDIGPYAAS